MTLAAPLTTDQLQAALAEVTYRPGWSFSLSEHRWEGTKIRILAEVRNSNRPDETITLGIDSFVPPMSTVAQFHQWLIYRLIRIESHEAREWLREHDQPLFNPHPEPAGR